MGKEGRTIFVAMSILFVIGLGVCFWSESLGNHAVAQAGITETLGNMEGKEVSYKKQSTKKKKIVLQLEPSITCMIH